jgi:hypothetical protein
MKKTSKADKPTSAPTEEAAKHPFPLMSFEEAAELAKIPVEEVFAVNDHGDRFHVITTAGQRIEVEKA